MLSFCLFAIGTLAIRSMVRLEPQISSLLDYADNAVCVVFFVDFLLSLWNSRNRPRYFLTWGWIDLLSSIPVLDVLRWGRLARVCRIFRVLRGVRAAKLLATCLLEHRAKSVVTAATLITLLLIVVSAASVLHFEAEAPDGNIKGADDAIWWAFATITTVGYGDKYPVTLEGRFVAGVLMCVGVGLFGTFSGFFAAWFLSSGPSESDRDLSQIKHELVEIRNLLDQRLVAQAQPTVVAGNGEPVGSEGTGQLEQ
jgi:voltage-gated potassium channel